MCEWNGRNTLFERSGANAAIFVAELENPYPTPPRITVSWEEATDVQKEKLNWFTVMAFEAISETYRQEIEKVYNFLLVEYMLLNIIIEIKTTLKNMGRK